MNRISSRLALRHHREERLLPEPTPSRLILVLAALALLAFGLAGCGGSDAGGSDAVPAATGSSDEVTVEAPIWVKPYLDQPGPEVALTMASSDFARGDNRLAFLIVRDDGSLVQAPTADVYYEEGGTTKQTTATLTPLGVDEAAPEEVPNVYVTRLQFPTAGKHWVVVVPKGAEIQGFQMIDVKDKTTAPAVGASAPRSQNPTLDRQPAERITTAKPPDVELLRHTVKDSVEKGIPFVVVFATPAYCQTRACGPAVEVIDAVRKRYADSGIRFIHIEIYEDNTPGKGANRWVREWNLPSEPWVFVVDKSGTIRDRFEGAVGVDEVSAAIEEHLVAK